MYDDCPVCMDEKELVIFDTCTHGVCQECTILLDKFQISTCPICRAKFSPKESEGCTIFRNRRRNLSKIEYVKRRQIIKARQRQSRAKKHGRNNKLHGENYF